MLKKKWNAVRASAGKRPRGHRRRFIRQILMLFVISLTPAPDQIGHQDVPVLVDNLS
jgi:hypothetical protein